jgi:hypothetical protein
MEGAPNGSWPPPDAALWSTAGSAVRKNGSRPDNPSRIRAKKTALNATDFRMIVLLVDGKRGK